MNNKRMAVDAQRLKKSKKYPRHWKYSITIEEVDGTINVTPAYGTDMEDALASVDLIARRSWLLRFFNRFPQWVAMVIGGGLMTGAAILSEAYGTPNWILGLLGVICAVGAGAYYANRSIEKHMVNNNE